MKSAQILTPRESVTITLTPEEQDFLLSVLKDSRYSGVHVSAQLFHKLSFLQPNIGDACRHSAHIPEVLGQGGTNSMPYLTPCFVCGVMSCPGCGHLGQRSTLTTCRHRLNRPELGACPYCQPQESVNLGQGSTNE